VFIINTKEDVRICSSRCTSSHVVYHGSIQLPKLPSHLHREVPDPWDLALGSPMAVSTDGTTRCSMGQRGSVGGRVESWHVVISALASGQLITQ
jgi:hypothetical protein